MTWGVLYSVLYLYRVAFTIIVEFVVLRITSIGDTRSYRTGSLTDDEIEFVENLTIESLVQIDWLARGYSTIITSKLGGFFSTIFYRVDFLIDTAFQTITFVGMVYFLSSLPGGMRIKLAVLLMLPSLSMWTAIASKEAIIVGCVCVICGHVARVYLGKKTHLWLVIPVAILLYVYKAQYFAGIAYLVVATEICVRVRKKAFTALLLGLGALVVLYAFRDKIDELAIAVQWASFAHSSDNVGFSRSTRQTMFFVDQYDVFLKAPLGIFVAFVGPKLGEIRTSPLHLFSLFESLVLISTLVFYVIVGFSRVPLYRVIIGVWTFFLIAFANYPFGVQNPGAAIRYRSGWLVFVFLVFVVLFQEKLPAGNRDHLRPRWRIRWTESGHPASPKAPAS